jgi:hypothetical protein
MSKTPARAYSIYYNTYSLITSHFSRHLGNTWLEPSVFRNVAEERSYPAHAES